jgi:multidrug efflux pump subunit AcrA (membrane-fusion protein)
MRRLALVYLIVVGCKGSSPDDSTAAAPAAPAALDTVQVVAKQLDTTVRLPAELAPEQAVALYPRVNAFVEEITVDRGSVVKKGQLLARLSASELSSQRAEAEAKAAAAKSTYDSLKAASSTPGAVAGHDLEVAQAALAAETSRVSSLRSLEGYLYVRAPFDGVITERGAHPGALVGPPTGAATPPMLRIEQIDHLRVELDVDNTGKKPLTPGAYAEVLWPVRREGPSLFVPATAIAQTTERTYVDRVANGAVEQVVVQRGVPVGDTVEVFGPLAAGDQVLKRGSEVMTTGTKVSTKPWTPPDAGAPPK